MTRSPRARWLRPLVAALCVATAIVAIRLVVQTRTSLKIAARIQVPGDMFRAAFGDGSIWVATSEAVYRIDPKQNAVIARVTGESVDRRLKGGGQGVAIGAGGVWVANPDGVKDGLTPRGGLYLIDPGTNRAKRGWFFNDQIFDVRVIDGSVWGLGLSKLRKVDPETGRVLRVIDLKNPLAMGVGFGSIWVGDNRAKLVTRVDPKTGRIAGRIPVPGAGGLTVTSNAVWVSDQDNGVVVRIDPRTNQIDAGVDIARTVDPPPRRTTSGPVVPYDVGVFQGRVFVTTIGSKLLLTLDPSGRRVIDRFSIPDGYSYLIDAGDALWLTNDRLRSLLRVELSS